MTLKKTKIISTIIILALCFLFHFLYKWFPNPVFALFFPVNESIWEHMKIIFSSICFYGIIDYIILNKKNISFNNFIFNIWSTATISVVIYLLIFIPIYNNFGENMFISIGLMIIVIIISQIFSYFILKSRPMKLDTLSLILIIISYIIFGYLTYNPVYNDIFLDTVDNVYGINDYNI